MNIDTTIERAYVKFARPTGPYVVYLILLFAFIGVPAILLWQGKEPKHLDIHEDFYYLAGALCGFYVAGRTVEKVKGMMAGLVQPPPPASPAQH